MQRQIGVGIIGLGWMGRVHTSSYGRVLEHFPDLGVIPRLVLAADVSAERRAHAELVGVERTVADWRAVVEDPEVDVVSITLPNAMHREVALAAIQAGKHVWVEKPVGRGLEDVTAVAAAARRAGVVNAVGFCYRFAPAVQHARALIEAGELGEINHYRGVFLADYANRPDAAASWRFSRAAAGSGALGDLMAHIVDMTHYLVGPIERLTGRTATMIARRPRLPVGEGTHFSRVDTAELVDVENEDWAAALIELDGGVVGSLEASRVIVGPHVRMRFEVHGTRGAVAWELERMNELERFQLAEDGRDEGYMTVVAGAQHPGFAAFQPGAGVPMGYDDLRVLEAGRFLAAVRDGEQRGPGLDEMLACARVLEAIERSAASGDWERAR
ncbi:MAG: Gfo/Idh/MocA family oxidoreductase [Actinomycetota bacterium]|nr:Gfo/Idh/MocA family oxidoreductase [Actinomycetota bacterium]